MSKLVFKPNQVKQSALEKQIELPSKYRQLQNMMNTDEFKEFELDESGNITDVYKGQSLEEMEIELDRHRREAEQEAANLLEKAKEEADSIVEKGKQTAFQQMQKADGEANALIEKAKEDAQRERERGDFDAEKIIKDAELKAEDIEHDAYKKGHEYGRDEGYKDGQTEVLRLIDRLSTVVSKAVDVRDDILRSSEKLMVDMILMIAKKVIKDEIEERKDIVINNIKEAAKRIKESTRVDIRVNFSDLDMTVAHKNELIKNLETVKHINVFEDSRVERGGCIIDTDLGSIDARISTQLDAVEEAIRNTAALS